MLLKVFILGSQLKIALGGCTYTRKYTYTRNIILYTKQKITKNTL